MRRYRLMIPTLVTAIYACVSMAQTPAKYLERAEVQRASGVVSVIANDPRPLLQALDAVSQEYGLSIDYEDPPYQSSQDVAVITSDRKEGAVPASYRQIGGREFRTSFPESPTLATSAADRIAMLKKMVVDYNASGNPGQFSVREGPGNRIEIVGVSVKVESGTRNEVSSVLDTRALISETKSASDAVAEILSAVTARTGTKVEIGIAPVSLMNRVMVTPPNTEVPARDALHLVLSQLTGRWHWRLLFDPDSRAYFFSVVPTSRVQYDTFENRRLKAIRQR